MGILNSYQNFIKLTFHFPNPWQVQRQRHPISPWIRRCQLAATSPFGLCAQRQSLQRGIQRVPFLLKLWSEDYEIRTGFNLKRKLWYCFCLNLPLVWIFDMPAHPHLQLMLGLVSWTAVLEAKLCRLRTWNVRFWMVFVMLERLVNERIERIDDLRMVFMAIELFCSLRSC